MVAPLVQTLIISGCGSASHWHNL